jgi:hypothetical protein
MYGSAFFLKAPFSCPKVGVLFYSPKRLLDDANADF